MWIGNVFDADRDPDFHVDDDEDLIPDPERQQNNDANPQAELRILPPVDTCWKIRTFLSHFTFQD